MLHLRKFENFHILLWLLKDSCWIVGFKPIGMAMIAPTLGLALYISWINRRDRAELAHNLAVCCWITANSVWMIGEFFYEDTLRPEASLFFGIGLVILMLYYTFAALKFIRQESR